MYERILFFLSLQSLKEPSNQQEALQAVCHQQTSTDPRSGFPEGEIKGKVQC